MKWHSIILVTLCIFASIGLSMAATIDVGNEYECKTIQAGVNAASAGDTVLVHAGTHSIDKSIMAKSDITIKGVGRDTIIYTDDFDDIADSTNMAMIYLNGVSNVEICDLSFVGPADDLRDQHENGGISLGGLREARNAIMVRNSNNIDIHNIYVSLILSDGVRISGSEDINVYDSEFNCAGHDAVSVFRSSETTVNNCYINIMINTGIRYDGSKNCVVSNCTFEQSLSGTGAGYIELEHEADEILIANNVFLKSEDPVLWTVYAMGGDIVVRDNAIYQCEGIRSSYAPFNVVSENNIQFASVRDWAALGYGYNKSVPSTFAKPGIKLPKVSDSSSKVTGLDNTASVTDGSGVIYPVDVEPVEVCDAEGFEIENCSNECIPENCSISIETGSTVLLDLREIARAYLNLNTENLNVSISLMQSGNNDTVKASELINGTAEEQLLSTRVLESSKIKLKCAQDLLNLSIENIEIAEYLVNQSCSSAE